VIADHDLKFNQAASVFDGAMWDLANPVESIRLPWWPHIDGAMGGLRPGELTLITAPTGAGKTQLEANLACQMLIQKVPTFVAPVETGDRDFIIRMCSVLEEKDWNTGAVYSGASVMALSAKYRAMFEDAPFYLATYDNRVALEDMDAMLRYQCQVNKVRVALLDNLNFFLKIDRSSDQNLVMDEAVRVIGNVAKQTGMHIILICHPKKTEGGRIVSEFDIKGSASLVQEAANVLLWNRPAEEHAALITDREAVFKKMRRRGTVVGKQFWFSYKGGKFSEKIIGARV